MDRMTLPLDAGAVSKLIHVRIVITQPLFDTGL